MGYCVWGYSARRCFNYFCLFLLLVFAFGCEGAEISRKKSSGPNQPEGLISARTADDGAQEINLVLAPKAPGEEAPSLQHLAGQDLLASYNLPSLNEQSAPAEIRGRILPDVLRPFSNNGLDRFRLKWINRDRSVTLGSGINRIGFVPRLAGNKPICYSSDAYVSYRFFLPLVGEPPVTITYGNGELTAVAIVERRDDGVYVKFNDDTESVFQPLDSEAATAVNAYLPLQCGPFRTLDVETTPRYLGNWTARVSPPQTAIQNDEDGNPTLVDVTPLMDFEIRGLTVDEVSYTPNPDDADGNPQPGGKIMAEVELLRQGAPEAQESGGLAWTAEVWDSTRDLRVARVYGAKDGFDGNKMTIESDWNGIGTDAVVRPDSIYEVRVWAVVVDSNDLRLDNPSANSGFLATPSFFGLDNIEPEITVFPNPYVPFDDSIAVINEDGDLVWPDEDGDGEPDFFPDFDNDGGPDYEPDEGPSISISTSLRRGGYTVGDWKVDVFPEDADLTDTTLTPLFTKSGTGEDVEAIWSRPPANLEPQILQVRLEYERCPDETIKTDYHSQFGFRARESGIRAQEGEEESPVCGAVAMGELTFGDFEDGILEIRDAGSDELLASSEVEPYTGASDPIASLFAMAGSVILSASNDSVLLKRPGKPLGIKISFITEKTDKSEIEVKISSTFSNKNSFRVSLGNPISTATKTQFSKFLSLSDTSGPDSIKITSPVSDSFTTLDVSSQFLRGNSYSDGNAQDGLEWESQTGTKLGFGGDLTPQEKNSNSYRREKTPPSLNAFKAAGFEDLLVEHGKAKAWARVKNQAERVYISGHGLTSGEIFTASGGGATPAKIADQWKDNIKLAIIAGCSVSNIGNFNGWENSGASVGESWKNTLSANSVILGYNATAPFADIKEPPGSLYADTRVLIRYRGQLVNLGNTYSGDELKAMAWCVANASMEVRIADDACAITDNHYYFIRLKSFNTETGERTRDSHDQNYTNRRSTERAVVRVHRSQWSKVGEGGLDAMPDGPQGKQVMRTFPDAVQGQADRI